MSKKQHYGRNKKQIQLARTIVSHVGSLDLTPHRDRERERNANVVRVKKPVAKPKAESQQVAIQMLLHNTQDLSLVYSKTENLETSTALKQELARRINDNVELIIAQLQKMYKTGGMQESLLAQVAEFAKQALQGPTQSRVLSTVLSAYRQMQEHKVSRLGDARDDLETAHRVQEDNEMMEKVLSYSLKDVLHELKLATSVAEKQHPKSNNKYGLKAASVSMRQELFTTPKKVVTARTRTMPTQRQPQRQPHAQSGSLRATPQSIPKRPQETKTPRRDNSRNRKTLLDLYHDQTHKPHAEAQ